ncbi:2,3-epoxybenzoyl-CoA dihydrolase [Achromobacter insolitus]|jgi:benzoyl-CoA-dihydrodiol lyase|uniref:2,3-epoxybenzoyl-CoA dihydrolase n=1 Tax=Achromobacter insolitus TaxID=217204 RepID=UPI0007C20A2A|nr:2,3-epoxybenzoyl-CoA dihydrolase [Achromobacter insolitus]GLK96001.1 benzoyl-CoA-dihydrodiol lyase [Achromobacter xylosoxidans]AVG40771.1 benzoyl-CoA-dihydrodiol lyase [Achromobacter insolitus]MDH3063146.1 2,3-epoxybenzoyl-CoA dihydrolase [Achromobacter insolitus]OAD12335.1 benzoyl-CoA-dihydrodiol lyase [Achromobacter insolitus]OAE55588.1 benzoyl-CoA-dihydrodiol lyase [Achromobacter insolitus]
MSSTLNRVDFRTDPEQYRHWRLSFDGPVATLAMDVAEDGGLRPGYKLKLNSYDLGVDIELHDALQRIRFEHPEVRTVVVTSMKDRIFCSGANIFMLGLSSHAWKVNFCKFTNETRNGIEDSSRHSGLKFIAALNGACAGGGYELALACDEIMLIDDRSSAVALPEVPLLGVLPGTGGLTRVTDKRRVRHDHADIFCTLVEGVRGQRAKDWRLVDDVVKPARFEAAVRERAQALAQGSDRPAGEQGIALTPVQRTESADSLSYRYVDIQLDREKRQATWTVRAPEGSVQTELQEIVAAGAAWWPLQMARELDDAILSMRTNELDIGTWIIKTEGDAALVLAADAALQQHADHWFVRETAGMLRRTLARLDVTSRSLFALIEPGSCFAGTLLELALAADRSYMLDNEDESAPAQIVVGERNFGAYPLVNGQSRLQRRFYEEEAPLEAVRARAGQPLSATDALELGLVTYAPDNIDWDDEVRMMLEERRALSPDALTGLEANLRFGGQETMETRIFGRLTAWQNWIFNRPNAAGDKGALKLYGKGEQAAFDWNRV